jgi:hypothetical protein
MSIDDRVLVYEFIRTRRAAMAAGDNLVYELLREVLQDTKPHWTKRRRERFHERLYARIYGAMMLHQIEPRGHA